MNILQWFWGILLFFLLLSIFGFFFGLSHPRKKYNETAISYNLKTKKFGVMYGAPSSAYNEEEMDDKDS